METLFLAMLTICVGTSDAVCTYRAIEISAVSEERCMMLAHMEAGRTASAMRSGSSLVPMSRAASYRTEVRCSVRGEAETAPAERQDG